MPVAFRTSRARRRSRRPRRLMLLAAPPIRCLGWRAEAGFFLLALLLELEACFGSMLLEVVRLVRLGRFEAYVAAQVATAAAVSRPGQ